MPWCEACAKFWNPNSMPADGTCPTCGRAIAAYEAEQQAATRSTKVPWHFWVMVSAVGLYLGWRLVQGVAWVVQQIAS